MPPASSKYHFKLKALPSLSNKLVSSSNEDVHRLVALWHQNITISIFPNFFQFFLPYADFFLIKSPKFTWNCPVSANLTQGNFFEINFLIGSNSRSPINDIPSEPQEPKENFDMFTYKVGLLLWLLQSFYLSFLDGGSTITS